MSARIDSLVSDLAEAIAVEDAARARTLIERLGAEYDRIAAREEQQVRRGLLLREEGTLSESETEEIDQLASASTDVELKRGTFLLRAATAVQEIEQNVEPDATFEEAVSEVQTATDEFRQQQENTEALIQDAEAPPSIEIVMLTPERSTLSVGERTYLQVRLANIGDKPADNVALSVTSGEGVRITQSTEAATAAEGQSLSESPEPLDTVGENEARTKTYEITGDQPGEWQIRADITSANAGGDSNSVTLTFKEADPVAARLGLAITDTNAPLEAGETLTVTARAVSIGGFAGTESVTLETEAATTPATEPVTVSAGGRTTTTLSVATDSEQTPGEYPVTVEASDSRAQTTVTITEPTAPAVSDYANDENVVTTEGLTEAISDWRADDIETPLLLDVIDAWRSDTPVS